MEKQRIGIDIGKVIIGGSGEDDTSFFSDDYLATPEVAEAFESIRKISEYCDVWIISKCGQKVQDRTLEWLASRNFYSLTGVNPEQVLFVRKRPEKAPLAKEIGLAAFVDDREDIINSMKTVVEFPVLFVSWDQAMSDLRDSGILPPHPKA